MFTDDGIFIVLDAQVEMTARVAYIIQITRITSEGFVSVIFKSSEIFLLVKTGVIRDFLAKTIALVALLAR